MKNPNQRETENKKIEITIDDEPPSQKSLIDFRQEFLSNFKQTIAIEKEPDFNIISDNSRKFMKKHFPNVSDTEWLDWKWQIRNSITSKNQLQQLVQLNIKEKNFYFFSEDSLPLRITPYYASLLEEKPRTNPIRKCVIPLEDEYIKSEGENADPLCEEHDSPVPNLVHRYPDRVLLLVTGFCSTYCRYCTRSRMVAKEKNYKFEKTDLEKAFEYIASKKQIRDVLLSGGDPLTLGDNQLDYILTRLRKIPHVEFIRIGTKVPVVLPHRITPSLISVLKKHSPIWLSIHFTHPVEMTPETKEACDRLADAGIPLGSQTVLLKGINDEVATMKKLVHELLKIRVRPYYLYQCDPISGSSHFKTTVERGLEIIQGLRGYTSGYAVPTYVIDAPGGGGKIPILPEYFIGREGGYVLLKNYSGKEYKYPDFC
ncbi:MAG TPA: KamA family radical SAM protein [Bacteroidales bacterium]|nr:KamA family radical SAM protein [Bacteroidales bacterium]HPS17033.1 KamA family radical SAM protein [Bacteroidales bacterium]